MRYKTMIAVEDQELGGIGLKFIDQRNFCNGMFTAQDGLIVAHDIIEHQQGIAKIGSIGDEMVALGGVCYTRAQWGSMTRNSGMYMYTPAQSIASDIHNMGRLYFENHIPFRQKLVKSRGDDESGLVDDVIECAREDFRKYWEGDEEDCPLNLARDSYLEDCRTYMLHGVKLAVRRFGSGHVAHDTFWAIEEAASQITKNIDFEGQQFRLQYCHGRARMYEVHNYEEY